MLTRRRLALALAVLQAADLAVTQTSPAYGAAHLDHLGVPPWLRPVLPATKLAAAVALVATAHHPRRRRAVGLALVPYYSAAATFHVLSGDRPVDVAPAAACAAAAVAIGSAAGHRYPLRP